MFSSRKWTRSIGIICSLVAFTLITLTTGLERPTSNVKPCHSQAPEEVTYYAAHGQDRWIIENIIPRRDQTTAGMSFVEAGSFDGLTGSNLATLELSYGWDGLCYEPNPAMFQLVKTRRAACKKFNAVLCDPQSTAGDVSVKYLQMSPDRAQESGVLEFMDEYNKELVKGYTVEREYDLKCRSLSADVNLYLNGHVDVLSLDVEGSELIVLKTVEWSAITIDIIFVERSHEIEVTAFLKSKNYLHVARVGHDNVFIRDQSPYLRSYISGCLCLLEGECKHANVYPDPGWLNCEEITIRTPPT
mmetsp:Transcript_7221/g.29293  ORF Transcript_7221/g.29293 Transcript_7221/m.29293 type:complete len:302 (+) Transcript_7221:124-1029(+)